MIKPFLYLVCALFWLACIGNLIVPFPSPWDSYTNWFALAVVALHIAEIIYFWPSYQTSKGGIGRSIVSAFFLGILYNYPFLGKRD